MIRETLIPFLAAALKPKIYVELGIGYAGPVLFQNMIQTLPNTEIWGVDIEPFENLPANVFKGTTCEFAQFWIDEQGCRDIDLIFVDADHSYEAVLLDVEDFFEFLTPDTGVMILHDTWPVDKDWTGPEKSGTAYKVVKTLREEYHQEMEVFTLPVHHGLTFIRKRGSDWRNE